MTDHEQFVAEKQRGIEECLRGIRDHLKACDDFFEIVAFLQEELQIWEPDIYGDWQRTMLTALPKQTQKDINKTRQQLQAVKDKEEAERRSAEQAAQRRAEEANQLRKEARQRH